MKLRFKSKSGLLWSIFIFGLYIYSLANSHQEQGKLCVELPVWQYDTLMCVHDNPIGFIVFSAVWIGGGLYALQSSFTYAK